MEGGCGVGGGTEDGCGKKQQQQQQARPQFGRSLTYHHHQGHRLLPRWRRPQLADEPRARPQAVVLYTTSLRGVRRTFADCSAARAFSLPQLFIGGRLVGGADEVRQLHESGQLRRLLEGAAGQDPSFVCDACGGVRFVPCPACAGSRKVFDEEEDRVLRCGDCNENGLVRCANCSS